MHGRVKLSNKKTTASFQISSNRMHVFTETNMEPFRISNKALSGEVLGGNICGPITGMLSYSHVGGFLNSY